MIKFFRDFLSGPVYVVVLLISIVLIMAIIGYLMEKKQKADEANGKIVHVGKKVKNENKEIPSTPVENAAMPQENNEESK